MFKKNKEKKNISLRIFFWRGVVRVCDWKNPMRNVFGLLGYLSVTATVPTRLFRRNHDINLELLPAPLSLSFTVTSTEPSTSSSCANDQILVSICFLFLFYIVFFELLTIFQCVVLKLCFILCICLLIMPQERPLYLISEITKSKNY